MDRDSWNSVRRGVGVYADLTGVTSVLLDKETWRRAQIAARAYGYHHGAVALLLSDLLRWVLQPRVWSRACPPRKPGQRQQLSEELHGAEIREWLSRKKVT